jgi:hypothetical protein
VPVPAGQTTFLVNFTTSPQYSAYWYAMNPNGLAGPSEYTIKAVAGGFSATVVDNGLNDRWQDLGKMWILLPSDGDYEICQTKALANTKLADPTCLTVTVKFGDPVYSGYFVSQWN